MSALELAANSTTLAPMGCNWEEFCLEAIDHSLLGVGVEVILLVVSFVALAILCDEYLVPSIECLCLRWLVPEDVAGSIFVALGSSAPEIIISAVATLRSKTQESNDVNLSIGAVIGSGAIAFLIIPAICILFAPVEMDDKNEIKPVEVKRRPLARDIIFYFVALSSMCYFMSDGMITLSEAATLCALYFIYLIVVVVSPKIRLHYQLKRLGTKEEKQQLLLKRSISFVDLIKAQKGEVSLSDKINSAHELYSKKHPSANTKSLTNLHLDSPVQSSSATQCPTTALPSLVEDDDEDSSSIRNSPLPPMTTLKDIEAQLQPLKYQEIYHTFDPHHIPQFDSVLSRKETTPNSLISPSLDSNESPITFINDNDDEEEDEPVCENPAINALYTIISAPISLLFELTIPQAKPHTEKEHLYPISFGISFLYLAFFSMIISSVFSRWTELTGVGGDFFGLILVSTAAELPDLVQSITSARHGYSSMAMACTSSQIANILVGFGVPYLLSILLRGNPVYVPGYKKLLSSAYVQIGNVIYFAIITVGFALWYKTKKVELVKWKAHLSFAMYGVSLIAFAFIAFLW